MNLFGRHVVRNVAAIGAGVALLVLGLEVPAYAAVPTITAILPTSPSPGCEASLTGTNFQTVANGGPITSVTFNQGGTDHAGTVAFIDTDTQAEVSLPTSPTLAGSTATTVRVHNTSGDSATFSFTTGAAGGSCPDAPDNGTPSSGLVGISVTIKPQAGGGTFTTAPTAVRFNTAQATPTASTATSVTATVPCGATTGRIHVYTATGQSTSGSNFTVTGGGAGAPTISNFNPTSGSAGTSVVITGTNFSGTGFTTTSVTFNAVTSTFVVNSATQITATVPSTATTGPIKVTTPCGSVTSTTNFTLKKVHSRSVTLRLSGKLNFAGNVKVGDGFALCRSGVPVKFQRRVNGTWKTIRSTVTTVTGKYAGHVKNKHGKYRALAPKVVRNGGADVCKKRVSPVRTH
jgi:IPT/TIG domain